MKKLILLFSVCALVLTSCSSDDDSGSVDPIIGVWKNYKYFENGIEIPLDPCEDQDTLIFGANGEFASIFYFFNGLECELDDQTAGSWLGQGNVYTITAGGSSDSQVITFENDTFYFEFVETFNGVTTVERDVYKRQ